MEHRAGQVLVVAAVLAGCGERPAGEAESFLDAYAAEFQSRYYAWQQADWASNTRIVEGDSTNAVRTRAAREAYLSWIGATSNIERIRSLLGSREALSAVEARQLEKMLFLAAEGPQTVAELVAERVAEETAQVERLYGFQFTLGDRPMTTNDMDGLLRTSTEVGERQRVWEASKEVGKVLRPGMIRLRDLRNGVVQALGYPDFFTYQVSDYGMTTDEMLALTDQLMSELRPLYRELHTWARHELAKRYGAPVPDLIPAHWLPNRWAQDWSALVTVEGIDVDAALKERTAEWVVRQGEELYRSLGFDALPATFWERSSLYPLAAGTPFRKNTHASAWHLDLDADVRSLMSVEPDAYWYETAAHELGHVYYFMSYSRPEVPLVLRDGANRAYHEAIGSMIGLAASQRRFLVGRGLAPPDVTVDATQKLLQEALNYIIFIPFAAGTMTRFEHALYAENLAPDQFNAKWWELVARYQGVAPPSLRGEEFADGLTKTHITDDAGQYYDYALSNALLFQLHDHIAREILQQDPHDTDYFGSTATGDFLRALMAPGSSRPWRDVLRETTGRELDARAMVDYFGPLMEWLTSQNRGREHSID